MTFSVVESLPHLEGPTVYIRFCPLRSSTTAVRLSLAIFFFLVLHLFLGSLRQITDIPEEPSSPSVH